MVSWRDPATQMYCAHAASFIGNICIGVYLWEFALSFPFDWQLFTRRRPFRWTQVPYLIARYTCGVAITVLIVTSNVYFPSDNCKAWWLTLESSVSAALLAASALLIIRVVAVTGFGRVEISFFTLYWLAEVGIVIYGVSHIDGVYVPELMACVPMRTSRGERLEILTCFTLYLLCLARLAFSLLRARGMGLWRLLCSQGVVYFVVVVVAFSSTSTFILLDLNDGINMIFEILATVSLVVCATRLYRGLVMYDASEPDAFISTGTRLGCKVPMPAAQPRGTISIALPNSFAQYSLAEEGRTPGPDHVHAGLEATTSCDTVAV